MKKRITLVLLLVWLFGWGIAWETGNPIDPDGVPVLIITNRLHSSILLRRAAIETFETPLARALLSEFPEADWMEFSWGDRKLYSKIVFEGGFSGGEVLSALLLPTQSVAHIATARGDPLQAFSNRQVVELHLTPAAVRALWQEMELWVSDMEPISSGLYGNSRFYASAYSYHGFRTCNNFVSRALRAGGVASSPLFSVLSLGLRRELEFRYAENIGVL